MKEGTDLIYEGITTVCNLIKLFHDSILSTEGTDLIYEGITTLSPVLLVSYLTRKELT
jgi:hypothetical protein